MVIGMYLRGFEKLILPDIDRRSSLGATGRDGCSQKPDSLENLIRCYSSANQKAHHKR